MNKRDAVLSVIDPSQAPHYTPAAFFLHFDPAHHRGLAAVEKHLEFFRYTGMDFVKIQFEHTFPPMPEIQQPEDWSKIPHYPLDFYAEPLKVVDGLVKAAKPEALVILTLYSPFMIAGQITNNDLLVQHIRENPTAVKRGMEILTDSLMGFVKECARLGLDGFYTSTQGGEAGRLDSPELFDACVRPYDLALMDEINRSCIFNILHVCDYHLPYRDLTPFINYPGHVVNTSLHLVDRQLTPRGVADLFGRPFMGGLERKAVLASGTPMQIEQAVQTVLNQAPQRFILGADCTVPGGTPWDNLATAVRTAHARM